MSFLRNSVASASLAAGAALTFLTPTSLAAQDLHPSGVIILGNLTMPVGGIQVDLGGLTLTNGSVNAGGALSGASLAVTGNAAAGGDLTASGTTSTGALCVGNNCTATPTILDHSLVVYEEQGSGGTGIFMNHGPSGTSWSLAANLTGSDRFSIQNLSPTGRTPFVLHESARTNALYVAGDFVGFGTSLPTEDLHVVSGSGPTLRLEQDGSAGNTPFSWDLLSNYSGDFGIRDVNTSNFPFWIESGSDSDMVTIAGTSTHVGFYEPTIQNSRLHIRGEVGQKSLLIDVAGLPMLAAPPTVGVRGDDGSTWMLLEESNTTQAARTMLSLQNHGRPDIIMGNTATGGEWAFGAGNNFVLKRGAVGSTDAEKTLHLKLFGATGNLEITGQIITGGGTCGGGCDAVFSPDYELPSIQAHADAMWKLGHLPNVGPTIENQPINVSDKLGRMLNELEHAHIYIAELEQRDRKHVADLADQRALLNALQARLARLEAAQPAGATTQ